MKRYLIIALFLIAQIALAQVQVLPDLEITGESQTKIFLYKKALPYSLSSSTADSLSPYVPMGLPELSSKPELPKKPAIKHYVDANASSNEALDLCYRYYHKGETLRSLGLQLRHESPEQDYQDRALGSYWDIDLHKYLRLRARAGLQDTKTPKLETELKSGQISLFSDAFSVGEIGVSELSNLLKYIDLMHYKGNQEIEIQSLVWQHQHKIDFPDFSLQNRAFLNGDNAAVLLQAKRQNYFFDESGIFVLFDQKHIIPGIAFNSSYALDLNKSLNVGNYPRILPHDFQSILSEYPYLQLSDKQQNTLVPLNLQAAFELKYPAYSLLGFNGVKLSNSLLYYVNELQLMAIEAELVKAAYQDVAQNLTELSLAFQKGDFKLDQSFALSLAWLAKSNWQIKPYSAPVLLDTRLSYTQANWDCGLGFEQRIGAHYGADSLPLAAGESRRYDIFDLSLNAAYQLDAQWNIRAKAANLLNTPYIIHKDLPAKGRAVELGLSYWF